VYIKARDNAKITNYGVLGNCDINNGILENQVMSKFDTIRLQDSSRIEGNGKVFVNDFEAVTSSQYIDTSAEVNVPINIYQNLFTNENITFNETVEMVGPSEMVVRKGELRINKCLIINDDTNVIIFPKENANIVIGKNAKIINHSRDMIFVFTEDGDSLWVDEGTVFVNDTETRKQVKCHNLKLANIFLKEFNNNPSIKQYVHGYIKKVFPEKGTNIVCIEILIRHHLSYQWDYHYLSIIDSEYWDNDSIKSQNKYITASKKYYGAQNYDGIITKLKTECQKNSFTEQSLLVSPILSMLSFNIHSVCKDFLDDGSAPSNTLFSMTCLNFVYQEIISMYGNDFIKNNSDIFHAENTDDLFRRYCEKFGSDYDDIFYYSLYVAEWLKGDFIGQYPGYLDLLGRARHLLEQNRIINGIKNYNDEDNCYSIEDVDALDGFGFERFVSRLFAEMGYQTEVTQATGDQGVDVIAKKGQRKIAIQVKCYSGQVGNNAIQEVIGGKKYYDCNDAIVVTNQGFTKSAIDLASKCNVKLWDRSVLQTQMDLFPINKE
jgi:hypothetical protein